jgi:sodium-dependent dicarboxylate transporter 2/3/5
MLMASGKRTSRKVGLVLGPVFFLSMTLVDLDPGNPVVSRMAGVAILMATWWITEAIPLFATALLPLVLFPLLGIERAGGTAPIYFNSTIVLFLGGFMIALTMEKWNLHRRIALKIIGIVGGGPSRIVLGFMVASGFLSMWISNTATAVMMVPIGLAIVLQMEEEFGVEDTHAFSVGVMLSIAYACSLGGLATLVGTPPNLAFARIFQITFPDAPAISFGQWMIMALPMSVIMLLVTWFLITKVFFRVPGHVTVDRSVVEEQAEALGPVTFEERAVFAVFVTTALLWVFRVPLRLGVVTIPGWSQLLPFQGLIDDGTVAITMAILLFLIPSRTPGAAFPTLAGADIIPRLPWGIVLLFGGGFALAHGFQATGLSELVGDQFAGLAGVHPLVLILIVCLSLTFLTELTSNTATTEMILPIMASAAVAANIHPLLLMIPATLSASCAFMMPVATPPNAIVFGSDRVRIPEMARIGLLLNLVGVLVIAVVFYFLGTAVFGIEPGVMPEWATFGG